ncbi:MAG: HAD family phosphatase [Candidatus Omnitrophica bacterium]|jgi:putative hydrolase of the HAD superfamily|nr:HAD family phosphatase [Candidatus Omnitrophota bacterium]
MSGIKAILFDLGNVLVDFDFKPAVERISCFCGKGGDEILKFFFDSKVTNAFEKGELSSEEFYRQVKDGLHLKLGYESFVPVWNEVFFFSAKNRTVYHIANCLKSKYRIGLLSNTNILHYGHIKNNFPVFNVFEKIFLSFEIGSLKPEVGIYQKVIKDLGVLPEDIFYTDDRQDLVKSAAALGIKSFVFTTPEQLIKDLASQDVVLEDKQEFYSPEDFLP